MTQELLKSFSKNGLELKNRIVMAPMTRARASETIPTPSMVTYYTQRASAGLIISEGVNITEQAIGSPYTPGIYTDEQIEGWKKVTEGVHQKGGKIFIQLWHTGRVGHSSVRNGVLPVAPSALRIEGQQAFTPTGMQDYEVPTELTTEEIEQIVIDYGIAAKNAITAGFDGVELHSAFGYLPNQFLVDGSNKRTDKYGGSVENRSRFVLEIMDELVRVVGPSKAGIKLSPSIPYNTIIDSDPRTLYTYLIEQLNKLPIAYIQLMEAMFPVDNLPNHEKDVLQFFGPLIKGTIMTNGGYTQESGNKAIESGWADLVSYGKLFISNPDLPERFEHNAEIVVADPATLYSSVGDKGYIDYPSLVNA